MLNKAKKLNNYTLKCIDGEIGKVKEFYFDDQTWEIRYILVNTGNWLFNRKVMISPLSILSVNHEEEYITTKLSKDQIENSPNLESEKPVSKQFLKAYHHYYAFPMYTGNLAYTGVGSAIPIKPLETNQKNPIFETEEETEWDPHLRSTAKVSGYRLHSTEDDFGHVDDFIIDVESWKIHYLEIDTNNWLPGKKVILSTSWIDHISWGESKVFVNLGTDIIKQAPEYTSETALDRDFETKLHDHYQQKGYWIDL